MDARALTGLVVPPVRERLLLRVSELPGDVAIREGGVRTWLGGVRGRARSPVHRLRALPAYVALLAACDSGYSGAAVPAGPPPDEWESIAEPSRVFCTETTPISIQATVSQLVRPHDTSEVLDSLNVLFPADIATSPDGTIWILDKHLPAVVRMPSPGQEDLRWGRTGQGPGEFRQPVAIAAMGNNGVAVLDGNRVTAFSRSGEHLDDITVFGLQDGVDLQWIGDRRFLVAVRVYRRDQERGVKAPAGYLIDMDANTTDPVAIHSPGDRPLIAPMVNDVKTISGRPGLLFMWDKWVDRVDAPDKQVAYRGCLDRSIAAAYERQYDAAKGNSQKGFSVSRAAWISESGRLFLAANGPDTTGIITVFTPEGEVEKTYSIRLGDNRFHWHTTSFFEDSATLVGWSAGNGHIDRWKFDYHK